jgi:hypothetical protein
MLFLVPVRGVLVWYEKQQSNDDISTSVLGILIKRGMPSHIIFFRLMLEEDVQNRGRYERKSMNTEKKADR